jgi:hypothetical protein
MPYFAIFPFHLLLSSLSPFSFPSLRFVPWCSYIPRGIYLSAPGVGDFVARKFCVCVYRGLKFCSALVSYSARPVLPGDMVPFLVICGPIDVISRRLLFCVSSCSDSIPKFHLGYSLSPSSYRQSYSYSDIVK